jgi:hypothetical protein
MAGNSRPELDFGNAATKAQMKASMKALTQPLEITK